jgi:hypothetical protein
LGKCPKQFHENLSGSGFNPWSLDKYHNDLEHNLVDMTQGVLRSRAVDLWSDPALDLALAPLLSSLFSTSSYDSDK